MKKNVSIIVLVSLILSSCSVIFPTQKMIDSILKNNNMHAYSISDLIPFNENELKNARSLYGMELNDYYNNNINAGLEGEDLINFNENLIFMDYNYNILLDRYNMFTKDEESYNECKNDYDEYYKLKDSKAKKLIKNTNRGSLAGAPSISALIDMTTLKDYGIYSEAEAEIFDQITITEDQYKKLKIGDTFELSIPATNSTIGAKDLVKKKFTYVATNSISYKETNKYGLEEDKTFFIGPVEVLNNKRKLVDDKNSVIEVYRDREVLQFMKYAIVGKGATPNRFFANLISKKTNNNIYYMNELAIKAQTGGYLVEEYKDELYTNTIYTNLKGYITQCINYNGLNYDNQYMDEYLQIKNEERINEIEFLEKQKREEDERKMEEQQRQMKEQEEKMNNILEVFNMLNKATSSEIIKDFMDKVNLKEEEVFGQEGYLDKMFNYASYSEIEYNDEEVETEE